jgi:hypothetical protein
LVDFHIRSPSLTLTLSVSVYVFQEQRDTGVIPHDKRAPNMARSGITYQISIWVEALLYTHNIGVVW